MDTPYLRDRLVLKGGTALNLFYFEDIPRLSVDIDLNYIGQLEREKMLEERPIINDAVQRIFQQNQFIPNRSANRHAGGKTVWRYPSVLGQMGNLEIDLNYMYRRPLWPIVWKPAKIYFADTISVPVLDIHELAAGKLSALFSRQASRDLFDAHYLLTKCQLENTKLRLAFVICLAMTKIDLVNLQPEFITYDAFDIRNRLLPVLRQENLPRSALAMMSWANKLTGELHEQLSLFLPLQSEEVEFISCIRSSGEIKPELLTQDENLANTIKLHLAIHWAVKQRN